MISFVSLDKTQRTFPLVRMCEAVHTAVAKWGNMWWLNRPHGTRHLLYERETFGEQAQKCTILLSDSFNCNHMVVINAGLTSQGILYFSFVRLNGILSLYLLLPESSDIL